MQTTSFVIRSPGEDLSLDGIGGQRFGVRYTSYGEQGGPREGSLKIAGVAPHAPDAEDDAARTIAESPTGFAVDIDVLANDSDDDDAPTVTSVDAAGSDGGAFSINLDGTVRFDPGSDFDDLDTGEFRTTSATCHVSDGAGGTDCAVMTVTVEGFDPGEQTNADGNGDIALNFTTAERTIDGTSPASATIALPDVDSDVAFIIDVSGSTVFTPFGGATGDVNGDGHSHTVLDAEISSYLHLLDEILADPAGTVNVHLISFASGGASHGQFEVTDPAGEAALRAALLGLSGGGAANFEAPLDIADGWFDGVGNEVAYVLSDGVRNAGGSWADEVASMSGKGVDIIAIGVGTSSSLAQLHTVDATGGAEQVTDVEELTAALLDSPFDLIDFRIEVNGDEVLGIDETDLVETPLGFTLPEQALDGLDVGEHDLNPVIAYAEISTDGNGDDAEVFLQVENFIDGVVYDELLA